MPALCLAGIQPYVAGNQQDNSRPNDIPDKIGWDRQRNTGEKDQSFKGTIGAIYQTFDGKELYPSIEEKAAHLLYSTIKNHSFIDGNKRIAAAIFLWFLELNNYLYSKNGTKRIPDNALVALCLLIAESDPKEKEMIVRVIVNLINKIINNSS